MATKTKRTEAIKARAAELQQLTDLEDEVATLKLRTAQAELECAQLKRQVTNLLKDRDDQDERIGWVRALVDGSQKRPHQVHDSKQRGRWVPA